MKLNEACKYSRLSEIRLPVKCVMELNKDQYNEEVFVIADKCTFHSRFN